jgi:REP element-mobilizing transposase RayT
MSRKYKFHDPEGLYFVSFATVYWTCVFIREEYSGIIVDNLEYCRTHKGLEVYAWCLMPNHVHLIIRAKQNNPETILGQFKSYTARQLIKAIEQNPQESRRDQLLWIMEQAGKKSSNVTNHQFWQHHNQPIELWSNDFITQKLDYIHANPVVAGFVNKPEDWKYSSAIDYAGGTGLLNLDFV